ncbi:MAG: DUF779 domain-containing protein [Acidimicrobiales bacterium]|jgi:uncharacterized protein (DUF779 family)|nr:DUF779 domain-containing protein [Acidimicrobiales bacterium]
MKIESTPRAVAVVARARAARSGTLTITIGTGCCESTAPFLYEDFWPGPDQAVVGEVDGVPVYAPEYLRHSYPGDDGVVVDVLEGIDAESLSIETEWACRLFLRGFGVDSGSDARCIAEPAEVTPTVATGGPSRIAGELPEALRHLRIR